MRCFALSCDSRKTSATADGKLILLILAFLLLPKTTLDTHLLNHGHLLRKSADRAPLLTGSSFCSSGPIRLLPKTTLEADFAHLGRQIFAQDHLGRPSGAFWPYLAQLGRSSATVDGKLILLIWAYPTAAQDLLGSSFCSSGPSYCCPRPPWASIWGILAIFYANRQFERHC